MRDHPQPHTKWILCAGLLLTLKCGLFYHQVIAVRIAEYRQLTARNVLNSIFFFDFAIIIALSTLAVFISVILVAWLMRRNVFPRRIKDHPWVVFAAGSLASTGFMIGIPWLIARFGMSFFSNHLLRESASFLHPLYLRQSVILSACVGLYFADVVARSKFPRWISLAFFLLPFSFAQPFALLWWNALDRFAPSKAWVPLRPILAAATVILPLSLYPLAQPFGRGLPISDASTFHFGEINDAGLSYCVKRRPGTFEVYQRLDTRIQRLARGADGQWRSIGNIDMGFIFNEAAFDFERGEAYVFNGETGFLYAVEIPSLRMLWKRKIPTADFPVWTAYDILLAVDSSRDVLYIAHAGGNLVSVDRAGNPLASTFFPPDGSISDLVVIPDSGAVLVLQNHRLTRLRPIDLKFESSVAFPSFAFGLGYDLSNRRLLAGFPKILKFGAFNPQTLILSGMYPAPAGVRNFEFDQHRFLLFLGSVTGVVELRDARDYKTIKRVRLLPWLHGLLAIPETGELIATAGDVPPVVWSYSSPTNSFDPAGWFLEQVERVAREIVVRTSSWPGVWFEQPYHFTEALNKTVLIVDESERQRSMSQVFLERMGCRAILAGSIPEAMVVEKENPFDLIVLSADLVHKEGKDPETVRREMRSLNPRAHFIWSIDLKSNPPMPETKPGESLIPKPYDFWNFAHVVGQEMIKVRTE